jgi:hypothetical protein
MKKNKKVNESDDVLYNTDFFPHLPGIVFKQGKDKRGNVTLLGGTFELCGRVRGQGEFTTFAIAACYLGLVASKAMKQERSSFPYELVQEMENFLLKLKSRSRRNHEKMMTHASALLHKHSVVADEREDEESDRERCVSFKLNGKSPRTFERQLKSTLCDFLKERYALGLEK